MIIIDKIKESVENRKIKKEKMEKEKENQKRQTYLNILSSISRNHEIEMHYWLGFVLYGKCGPLGDMYAKIDEKINGYIITFQKDYSRKENQVLSKIKYKLHINKDDFIFSKIDKDYKEIQISYCNSQKIRYLEWINELEKKKISLNNQIDNKIMSKILNHVEMKRQAKTYGLVLENNPFMQEDREVLYLEQEIKEINQKKDNCINTIKEYEKEIKRYLK